MKRFIVFMLGVLVGFFLAYSIDDSENKSPLKSLFGGEDSTAVAAVAPDSASANTPNSTQTKPSQSLR